MLKKVAAEHFANASSIHSAGRKARALVETARRQASTAIHASPAEIIFTGGGSEANNLVLWNLIRSNKRHVITSAIEHPSVLRALEQLQEFGVSHTSLPVDSTGQVLLRDFESAIQEETGLISIMFANNEVGTIQPIPEIVQIAHSHSIPVHSDGVQALGKIEVNVTELGIDYMSFSGHKFYGPKGIGFLYARKGTRLRPLIIGGGQEHGLRAGTENTPAIAGLGLASELALKRLATRQLHLNHLEQVCANRLKALIPTVQFNGHETRHLPGVLSISIPSIHSDILLANLDRRGMAVSSGSACSAGTVKPSPVLRAMGISDELNLSTLRISFGRENTMQEAKTLAQTIAEIVRQVSE